MTLSEFTTSPGIWKGWHWRTISLTVAAVAVLQLIAYYLFTYDLVSSLPIAVLSVSYLVILRVRERRLANALVAVGGAFIVGVILQIALQHYGTTLHGAKFAFWLQSDLWTLAMGLVMAYAYLMLTQWSERKKAQLDAKRSADKAPTRARTQAVRHHSKKRKGKRR